MVTTERRPVNGNGTAYRNGATPSAATQRGLTGPIKLYLDISDPNLGAALSKREEPQRSEFAITAMKIGVAAIRQAQGAVDSQRVQDAGERVIRDMTEALERHRRETTQQINDCVRQYFDPNGGLFTQRVRGLVGEGERVGELEQAIRRQVDGSDSALAKTLAAHVGKESALLRTLDPASGDGIVAFPAGAVETSLAEQRQRILSEFTLDDQTSALSRLVAELRTSNGDVGRALEERISSVVSEFSLDRQDSALSRLVGRVEAAHRQISGEFSLNSDGSALARLRKELLGVIEAQNRSNTDFQREVLRTLTEITARKQEAEKGTQHGLVFEDAVAALVSGRVAEGDTVTRTGNSIGLVRHSKKGDVLIEMGPETAAPGARVVVEAKQDASYTVQKALAEMAEARKNRGAGVGVFVFSKRTAPAEAVEPVTRYGDDVVVVWDAEDHTTDTYLTAALSVAKALSVRAAQGNGGLGVDIEGLEKAIREIERQANSLEEITKSAQAIDGHVTKILDRARIARNGLERQVGILDEQVAGIREAA